MFNNNIQGAFSHIQKDANIVTDNVKTTMELVKVHEESISDVTSFAKTIDYTQVAHLIRFQVPWSFGDMSLHSRYLRIQPADDLFFTSSGGTAEGRIVLVQDADQATPVFLDKIPDNQYTDWVGQPKATVNIPPV
jgi:hypothetical protein